MNIKHFFDTLIGSLVAIPADGRLAWVDDAGAVHPNTRKAFIARLGTNAHRSWR